MSYWFARAWHILGTIAIYVGSGSLTFIFFQAITPPGLWWFPIAALGLFEFGIVHWSSYHREVAENPQQAVASVVMVALSVLGVAVSTGLELVRMLAPTFGLSLGWMSYSLWLVVFIFPLNVLGVQLCKMLSNDHQEVWAALFERSGEHPSLPRLRPIKIRRGGRNKEQVKETTPADDRKQLDGPTEEIEVSNLTEATPVKKKLPPLKIR
jgi:hypothetical protein